MSRLAYTDGMALEETRDNAPSSMYEHYCEHPACNEWGGFGFSSGKSAPIHWWCARHYPYWSNDVRAKYEALPG